MKPGDKVRFIHGKEEGIVRRIINSRDAEVEIQDGFLIPALMKELVVVASAESFIAAEEPGQEIAPERLKTDGIYLAFVPFNDRIYSIQLINESDLDISFTFGSLTDENYTGISTGSLKSNAHIKVGEASVKEFDSWPSWIIQCLYFSYGRTLYKEPLVRKLSIKASTFYKSKKLLPIINEQGYLFKIDDKHTPINKEKLVQEMYSAPQEVKDFSRPAPEIDLHIEKLTPDHLKLSNSEMLEIQLRHFQKNLDNAIASGMDEITFIHGVGNGILKLKIQEILSRTKSIAFFKDAKKEKFGYGATLVKIN
jgi:hypothetical protein